MNLKDNQQQDKSKAYMMSESKQQRKVTMAPTDPQPKLTYCDGYSAEIQWEKQDKEIDYYNVCYRYGSAESDVVLQTRMHEITLCDLRSGCEYSLTVQAVKNETCSKQSKVVKFITAPLAPTNLQVRLFNDNSVKVTFEDPDPREKEYEVVFSNRNMLDKKSTREHFLYLQLDPGQLYEFYVRAITPRDNRQGIHDDMKAGKSNNQTPEKEIRHENSDEEKIPESSAQNIKLCTSSPPAGKQKLYSVKSVSKELWTYPAKLASVELDAKSKDWLIYTWPVPAVKPKEYKVVVKANGATVSEDTTNTESFTIMKPHPATRYKVLVYAVNDAGCGEACESDECLTVPAAPMKVDVRHNPQDQQTSIIVTFNDNNPPGTTYRVEAFNAENKMVQYRETDKKQAVINQLLPGESYTVTVVAIFGKEASETSYFM